MFTPEFASLTFGLLSAIIWGAGDFSGGLASKRTGVYSVVIGSQMVGLVLLILLAVMFDPGVPPQEDWLWGGAAGLMGAVGLLALYRGLAAHHMGLVAPVSAVLAAAVPVVVTAVTSGLPTYLKLLGFAFALVGVWLLSQPAGKLQLTLKDLALPLTAGLGFGLFFVFIHNTSPDYTFWPIVAARLASLGVLSGVAKLTRQPFLPARAHWPLVALAGVLDAGGNAFFKLAAQTGRLDIASVLSSLYPASTVALAGVVLKERLNGGQWLGVFATLLAIVLIAL